jgi:arylsulfatase
LTADIEVPDSGVEGMIVTQGGNVGGYGLYVRDGRPTFVYNYLALDRFTLTAQNPLPKGKVRIEVDLVYKGGAKERGKAMAIAMRVNGTQVAQGELAKSIPNLISFEEGLDVGMDSGSPVDFTYRPPFAFTGKIAKVVIDLK